MSDSGVIGNWEEIFQSGFPRQWLPLTKRDIDKKGNVIAFGPVAQEYSELEALLLVLVSAKLAKTPEGLKQLTDIVKTYLTQAGHVISSLQKSSASNVYTALINQFVSCKIYARLGLMTSFDCVQTEVWLDHVMGEMLKAEYVQQAMQGLTTLVDVGSNVYQTHEKEEAKVDIAGLTTLAKLFGGK